ncbi:hypothetical protein BCR34DRAFT_586904 [Clohesyomyces aquaticus]|uniref:VWFA domain-containing protein n=1 Tax=Clohesyomyces aquaticus TaxID=1231657 RepID=A0A1Y1ZRG3_9PLEO|nr:hypothetical protein BCR34DRAFT_586904 [Clohesyomyces aquaticus]
MPSSFAAGNGLINNSVAFSDLTSRQAKIMAGTAGGMNLSHHAFLIPSPLRIQKRNQRAAIHSVRPERTCSAESIGSAVTRALEDISTIGWHAPLGSQREPALHGPYMPASWDPRTVSLSRAPSYEPLRIRKTRCSQSTTSGSSGQHAWTSGSRLTSQTTSTSRDTSFGPYQKSFSQSRTATRGSSMSQKVSSNFDPSWSLASNVLGETRRRSEELNANVGLISLPSHRAMSPNELETYGPRSNLGEDTSSVPNSPFTRPSSPALSSTPIIWSPTEYRSSESNSYQRSEARLALQDIREELKNEADELVNPKEIKRQPSLVSIFKRHPSRKHPLELPKRASSESNANNRSFARRRTSIFQRQGRDRPDKHGKINIHDLTSIVTLEEAASFTNILNSVSSSDAVATGSSISILTTGLETQVKKFKLQLREKKPAPSEAAHLPVTTSLDVRLFPEAWLLQSSGGTVSFRFSIAVEATLHNPRLLSPNGIDLVFVIDNAYYAPEPSFLRAKTAILAALDHLNQNDRIAVYTTHKTTPQAKEIFLPNELCPLQSLKRPNLREKIAELQFHERQRPEGTLHRALVTLAKSFRQTTNPDPRNGQRDGANRAHVVILSSGDIAVDKLSKAFPQLGFHHLNPGLRKSHKNKPRAGNVTPSPNDLEESIATLIENSRREDPIDELLDVNISLLPRRGCRVEVEGGASLTSIPRIRVGDVHVLFATIRVDTDALCGSFPLLVPKVRFKSSLYPQDVCLESSGPGLAIQELATDASCADSMRYEKDVSVEFLKRRFVWEINRSTYEEAPMLLKKWVGDWQWRKAWSVVGGLIKQAAAELEMEGRY